MARRSSNRMRSARHSSASRSRYFGIELATAFRAETDIHIRVLLLTVSTVQLSIDCNSKRARKRVTSLVGCPHPVDLVIEQGTRRQIVRFRCGSDVSRGVHRARNRNRGCRTSVDAATVGWNQCLHRGQTILRSFLVTGYFLNRIYV